MPQKKEILLEIKNPKKDPAHKEAVAALQKKRKKEKDKDWYQIGLRMEVEHVEYLKEAANVRGLSLATLCRLKIIEAIHAGRI